MMKAHESSPTPTTARAVEAPARTLSEIGRLLEERIEVRDRRYRLRLYRDSFLGSDAVTCLVDILRRIDARYTRHHAETLGRHLATELNLFQHVTNDRVLCDDYFLYRFVEGGKRRQRFSPTPEEDADFLDRLLLRDVDEDSVHFDEFAALGMLTDTVVDGSSLRSGSSPDSSDELLPGSSARTRNHNWGASLDNVNLHEAATAFEIGVEVKKHRYHGRTYEDTFVGTDAVDFLMASGLATSRRGAVLVGQGLMEEFHLFEHVARDHVFKDDYLFYRFVPLGERRSLDLMVGSLQESFQSLTSKAPRTSLQDIAEAMEQSVNVENRRFRLKTYKQCFIGRDAVSFFVGSMYASSRMEAVALGRRLSEELHLFEHVTLQHQFEDDFFFYRFTDPLLRKRASANEVIGSQNVNMALSLSRVATEFRGKVATKTNYYHFKRYKHTFIGSDAVSYLVNSSLAKTRKDAVILGRRLSSELNLFHHAKKDHPFKDDFLFYRFTDDDVRSSSGSMETHTPEMLAEIARAMRKNVRVKDRRSGNKVHKNCFRGTDAVSYLVNSGAANDRLSAVELGCEIESTYKVFEHVERAHKLKDERLLYRFTVEGESGEERTLSTLRSLAEFFHDRVEVKSHRFRLRTYKSTFIGEEAVSLMVDSKMANSRDDAVELGKKFASTFHLFEHVTRDHEFEDRFLFYRFIPEDQRLAWTQIPQELEESFGDGLDDAWNMKLAAFGAKASQRRLGANGSIQLSIRPGSSLGSIMNLEALRLKVWLSEFRRLDPRWRILNYFAEVAQLGALGNLRLDKVHPLLWFLARSTVFTVWRPTSFEAIRKMMLGDAVGKGLDIKGKSAKRGKLDGFVPFLQISENRHKPMTRTLCKSGRIRLFFAEDSFAARETVVGYLEAVAEEMMEATFQAKQILASEKVGTLRLEEAKETLLWDMTDVSITYLDEYAPCSYGIEIPARLLWEAYVVRQDCFRKPGSQYDIGRPSTPAFQDMNLATLQVPAKEGYPRAVLWSNASSSDPLNVHELLMAYEENGRVRPVVSDFDPFLIGTRRVHFDPVHGGLPSDQLDVLKWCVNQIGKILDSPTRPESWTNRWLEVLKRETQGGFHPLIPKFGFGDPKSYSLIENAVDRLTRDGSVRHGAESFNFYFPQEQDEKFLVIFDGLGAVPWQYMDGDEVRQFLSQRIDDGFTFPLNPKWVLCDPGWKELYDKLISSEKEDIVNSMKIWYPPESGIRELIQDISTRHPEGFVRGMRR
jgi:Domain found in Dishevelled, Egl-10, and Pleckstrin (DEP)